MANEKRKSVTIDESIIRGMIDGDKPAPEDMPEEHTAEVDPLPVEVAPAKETPDASKPRKRREPKDYGGVFLTKRPPATKKQTYIGAALFIKITEIMAVIASDVTLPTFLDNVLDHHLETYRDEINELYENKTNKKPL
jgi:hypothetical protein